MNWGCDAATSAPQFELECWECRDERRAYRRYCTNCDGTEKVPVYRCWQSHVGSFEDFCVRAASFIDKGLPPLAGAWSTWPAPVVEGILLACAEKVEAEKRQIERARNG